MKRWIKINNKLSTWLKTLDSSSKGSLFVKSTKRGNSQAGFTIIEVMVVLAVTSMLLVTTIIAISGRQAKTEFQQAARDIEHRTQSIMNDVSTGFFAVPENFGCRVVGGNILQITQSGITSGQCIFIGKALQFEPASAPGTINQINIMGIRLNAAGEKVSNLDEAQPRTRDTIFTNTHLLYGLRAERMFYTHDGADHNIGAVAFMSRLSEGAQSSQLDLYPLTGTGLSSNNDDFSMTVAVQDLSDSSLKNPSGGFTVCFEGGVSNQYAVMRFGGSIATPTMTIHGGGDCGDL